MKNLEPLLTHADDQRPVLGTGLPMDAAGTAPRPPMRQDFTIFVTTAESRIH